MTGRWVAALCIFAATLAFGEKTVPFLWRLNAPECRESWIFGSIHVPSPAVTNLPPCVERAFLAADEVVCEIPFDHENTSAIVAASTGCPQTLAQLLPSDLYKRCEELVHRTSPAFPLSALDHMELWAFSYTILMFDAQVRWSNIQPLDLMFYRKAESLGKKTSGLETAQEQIAAMNSFTKDEFLQMLRLALDDEDALRAEGKTSIEELVRAYCTGDAKALAQEISRTQGKYPKELEERFERIMLVERNKRMAQRMLAKMRAEKSHSFFFVIGALHGTDKQNVPELLAAEGVSVEREKE